MYRLLKKNCRKTVVENDNLNTYVSDIVSHQTSNCCYTHNA